MRTYKHSCAYRHHDGQVEGFVGFAKSILVSVDQKIKEAEADAHEQIKRKLAIINDTSEAKHDFDVSRVINDRASLTDEEWETVSQDWKVNVRY